MPTAQPQTFRTPILPLSPDVAERIAAGEVIERPVSVVKELVENALDADAHEIHIEIRGGGLRLIRVKDDGYGIIEEQIERAIARHSTSKIVDVDDLNHLSTLGFRGEALASIAAVSEFMLLSRDIESESLGEEHAATFITLRGGEITQRGRRARVHGTTVTVRDLFYNVPARLKFMRDPRTEAGHITQLLRRFAVGYPDVRFHLEIEERSLLQTSGSGNLASTLAELYHLPLAEMLNPISFQSPEEENKSAYKLHGYVGNRALAQGSRQHITVFINSRWVQSRSMQEAIESGYRGLLPKGKHPLLVLRIDLPAEELDANVHPAKTEVKLMREAEISVSVTQTIRAVLERTPALPEVMQLPGPELVYQRRLPSPRRRGLRLSESAHEYPAEKADPMAADIFTSLRPLAQLQQAVILAEAPDGSLYLIDQHRAHERVIYEHLRSVYMGSSTLHIENEEQWTDAHLLLEPVIVEMKRHEAELFEQRLPVLRSFGLECERFGGRSFLIRSVPGGEGQEQLVGHLSELAHLAAEDSIDWQDRLLIGLACRSALRRGRELGIHEQRSLITSLSNVSAPAVCPHGSPILLHYSRTFLIDKFDW
ncbi:MAG: DNA mismatch repair endonuclease MutL [Ktedonobacteraceae bacterium]